MRNHKRVIGTLFLMGVLSLLAPVVPHGHDEHNASATPVLLFLDWPTPIFDICITECPNGAEESEFCCTPPE